MRRPVIAANWKMHKIRAEAVAFVHSLRKHSDIGRHVDVVIAPSFPLLESVRAALDGSAIALAAQNVHSEPGGAFTGEVSAPMLANAGCRYVIVGHSERRALFHESSADVAAKLAAVQHQAMTPILCVGETLEEREAGRTETILAAQLEGSLAQLDPARATEVVLAYEPVWAIGTGRTATPEQAQSAHAFLRERLASLLGNGAAEAIRIQYGGSVKPENAGQLLSRPDIDGALVGGASLDAESFFAILRAVDPQEK